MICLLDYLFCLLIGSSVKHSLLLSTICRICGQSAKKLVSKINFKEELLSVCNIDVEKENNQIFPSKLCANHAAVLYKYRNAKKAGKGFTSIISVLQFESHRDNNCFCQEHMGDHGEYSDTKRRKLDDRRVQYPLIVFESNTSSLRKDKESSGAEEQLNELESVFNSVPTSEKTTAVLRLIRTLSKDQQISIICTVINYESKTISSDIDCVQNSYSNIKDLNKLDLRNYYADRNEFVRNILQALTKTDGREKEFGLTVTLENIYKLRNTNFIGPVSMMQNLTVLSLTGSKTSVDIIGTSGAGGKYSTLCRWLDISSEKQIGPSGDAVYMFDNEQVVGRTWSIKPNNKVNCSVITTVAAAGLNESLELQSNKELHPSNWFNRVKAEAAVDSFLNESNNKIKELKQVHFNQMKLFIDAAIKHVLDEQNTDKTDMDKIDNIVRQISLDRDFKICLKCGMLFSKTKRKCQQCKESLCKRNYETQKEHSDEESCPTATVEEVITKGRPGVDATDSNTDNTFQRYDHIASAHTEEPIKVQLMDPLFVNPNSYENLTLVLRHIGKLANLKRYGGNERDWLTVCCDGLPYSMILHLTQEYMVCKICREGVMGIEIWQKHIQQRHQGLQEVEHILEFDWVHLKTGDGHVEMNMMKSFVELNWEVFFKDLVQRMGWKSDIALQCAKNCSDNHKTWQLLLIYHFGTLMELVIPYVRRCIEESIVPTADGFIQFTKKFESDPNYMYLLEMTTIYSQSIINFRMGIRRNNSLLVQSAKLMSRGLFHGRNHPRYQCIEIVDSMQRELMPEEMTYFVESHESMSKTGDKSRGQGFDFILEELNKEIKVWMHRGVPTDNMWLSVCRNHDFLKSIRETLLNSVSVSKENATKKLNLEAGIEDWSVCLRDVAYLTKHSLLHTSVSGKTLHQELIQFTDRAKRKRAYRVIETFMDQDPPDDITIKQPVFVTNEEAEKYEKLENQSNAAIEKLIISMIDSVPDDCVKSVLQQKYQKEIRRKKKSVLISFFHEVEESLQVCFDTDANQDDTGERIEEI